MIIVDFAMWLCLLFYLKTIQIPSFNFILILTKKVDIQNAITVTMDFGVTTF